MTEDTSQNQNAPIYKNYACYRTFRLGMQQVGYIVATAFFLSELEPHAKEYTQGLWANVAWTLDQEGKYKIGQTYDFGNHPPLAHIPDFDFDAEIIGI